MHEVSLAEGVIDVVERAAEGAHATAVSEVRVAVGELSNVEIEALAFAFESVHDLPERCPVSPVRRRLPDLRRLSGSGFRGTRHAGRGYQGDNPRRFG